MRLANLPLPVSEVEEGADLLAWDETSLEPATVGGPQQAMAPGTGHSSIVLMIRGVTV